jgi:hypothetical protein
MDRKCNAKLHEERNSLNLVFKSLIYMPDNYTPNLITLAPENSSDYNSFSHEKALKRTLKRYQKR